MHLVSYFIGFLAASSISRLFPFIELFTTGVPDAIALSGLVLMQSHLQKK